MTRSRRVDLKSYRLRPLVVALALAPALLLARPVAGQTSGEAHVVFVSGLNKVLPTDLSLRGLTGGGTVLLRNRIGLDAEFGLIGDNSDERVVAPAISAGGSLHFSTTGRVAPFVGAGFSRLGDWAGWYAGGGANYWLNRRTAIHLGLRAFVPTTNYGCLSSNSRNVCEPGPRVVFLRVGLAFGFGK